MLKPFTLRADNPIRMADEPLLERAEAFIRERGLLIVAIVCTSGLVALLVAPKVYAMCTQLAGAVRH